MKDKKIIGDGLSKKEDTPPFKEMRDKVDKLIREEARILRNGKMRLHSTRRDRRPFLSNYGLLTLLHLYVPPPNATLRELSRARIFYENRPGGRYKDFKRYQDISIYTSPAVSLYKDPNNIYILFRGKDKEMDTLLDLLENIKFEAFIEEKGYNRKNEKWSKYYKRRVEQEGNGTLAEWKAMWGFSDDDDDDGEEKEEYEYDNEYALQYENFKKAHQNFSRRLFGKIISSRRFADAFYDANEGKDIVSYEKIYKLPANLTDLLTQLKDNGYKSADMADNDEDEDDGEEKEEGELIEEKDGEEKADAPEEGEERVEVLDGTDIEFILIKDGKKNYLVDNENRVYDNYSNDRLRMVGEWNEEKGVVELEKGKENADFTTTEFGVDAETFYLYPRKLFDGWAYTKDEEYGDIYKRENGEMIKRGRNRFMRRDEWITDVNARNSRIAREERREKDERIAMKKQDGDAPEEEKDGEEKADAPEEEIDEKDVVVIRNAISKNNYLVDNKNRVLYPRVKGGLEVIGKWNEKKAVFELSEDWDKPDFEDVIYPGFGYKDAKWFNLRKLLVNGLKSYMSLNIERTRKDKTHRIFDVYSRVNGEMKKTGRTVKRLKKKIDEEKKQDGGGHPIELRILKNKGKEYYVDNEGIIYNTTSGEQIGTWIKNRPVIQSI